MRKLLGVLLLSLACRSSAPSEPKPKPAQPEENAAGSAAAGSAAGSATGSAAKPEEPPLTDEEKAAQRKERAAAALARIPKIQQGLAKLRGLEFRSEVPAAEQSAADFRAFLRASIDDELPAARAAAMSLSYARLGFLERDLDLRKTLEDAMASQAGAYYDPKQQKFFFVMVPSSDMVLDTISAHELTHALQDQHYGLEGYFDPKSKGLAAYGNDAMNARHFVVEGDATLAMIAYVTGDMTKQDVLADAKLRPVLEMQLSALGKQSIDELKKMSKEQTAGFDGMDDDIGSAVDAMDQIPLVLLVPLLESYTRGALPIFEAFKQGGWPEVAKLYTTAPPESTEQMLHPATKLYPTRDLPKLVTLPKPPAGYALVSSDSIGELEWRVYFLLWDKASAELASEGWDGDRYAVMKSKSGELLAVVATTWDSEKDAEEFAAAYQRSLVKRFGGDGKKRDDGTPVLVERRGSEVFVVDGKDAAKVMAGLGKGVKVK